MRRGKVILKSDFYTTNGKNIFKVQDIREVTIVDLRDCETGDIITKPAIEIEQSFVPIVMPAIGQPKTKRGRPPKKVDVKKMSPGRRAVKEKKPAAPKSTKTEKQTPEFSSISTRKGGSSKYKGVSLNKRSGKWSAQVNRKEGFKSFGEFVIEEDAAAAVQKFLGNTGEARRLRELAHKIAAQNGDGQPSTNEAVNESVQYECLGCGNSTDHCPTICEKCNGRSFEAVGKS